MRKRNYEIIRTIMILISVLTVFQTLFLIIKPDTLRIILSIVVYISLIVVIVMFAIAKNDLKKVIYEGEFNNYQIRLVEDDDFQYVRTLLDSTPLENSPEEIAKLNEYQKVTIDFTRIDYHYIVFKDDNIICIFQSEIKDNISKISFKNKFDELNEVVNVLKDVSTSKKYEMTIEE